MRMQALAILTGLSLVTAFSGSADADGYRRRARVQTEISVPAPFWTWTYRGPVPEGAYFATVSYGPGNQRCVSQLVQLPNRWWRPVIKCE